MIALAAGLRVYIACGVTDMRRGMTGLAMLVQQGQFVCKRQPIPTFSGVAVGCDSAGSHFEGRC